MTQPIIVFDLDGTLVDTAPDLLDSLNFCLSEAGIRQAGSEELRHYVGHGGKVMISRAFEAQQQHLPAEKLDRLLAIFLNHYSSNIPGRSRPFDGVRESLHRFEEAGFQLAVCTNKLEGLAVSLLEGLQLRPHFIHVSGADTYDYRKPDPRHLQQTIADAGCLPDQAIMIGDSETDIATAQAASIPVVAVDFGYCDGNVRDYAPTHVISHFNDLTVSLARDLLASNRSGH